MTDLTAKNPDLSVFHSHGSAAMAETGMDPVNAFFRVCEIRVFRNGARQGFD